MSTKIGLIHTSFVSVDHLKQLFGEILPSARMVNIVDDSLLPDVIAAGGATPAVITRVCTYALTLERSGCDLLFNQCSSVGEAADVARQMISVPYLKVDEPMAHKAVATGPRISVVATVASTVGPSVRLVERAAAEQGKDVTVKDRLVDGALDILMKEGNREKHNQLVLKEIEAAQKDSDVIVLAQGSMAVLEPYLNDFSVPVLTSPRLGVEAVRDFLEAKK